MSDEKCFNISFSRKRKDERGQSRSLQLQLHHIKQGIARAHVVLEIALGVYDTSIKYNVIVALVSF